MLQLYAQIVMIVVGITLGDPVHNSVQHTELSKSISSKLASVGVISTDVPTFTIQPRFINISGTEFANSIMNVGPTQTREDLIFAQYLAGNIPEFMRTSIPIRVNVNNDQLTYWVLPDVLCVGTDKDYLRTPLNPLTARKVADLFGAALPTRKMAQQIWQAATVKLNPSPNGPPYDATMMSTERMVFHNKKIQDALGDKTPGELISGHKKDVVISAGLLIHPKNVAIVGWWYPSGQIIQPLNYLSHDRFYKDYSHGIRLVHRMMNINGRWFDMFDVLRNGTLTSLISDEGTFDATQMYA